MNGNQHLTSTIKVTAPEDKVGDKYVANCKRASIVALTLVALIGFVEAVGWALGIEWIKRPIADERAMPSGAALLFTLSAITMLVLSVNPPLKTLRRWLSIVSALFIGLVSGATWCEHVFERDWSLTYPLFQTGSATPLTFPGPMMPDVSAYFVLTAIAISLYALKEKIGIKPMQVGTLATGLPNLMIFLCFFCGMEHLCAYFGCIKFSPITSMTFVLLSLGIILSDTTDGITNIFVRDTSGGKVARKLCLLAILLSTLIPTRLILVKTLQERLIADESIVNLITSLVGIIATGIFVAWSLGRFDTVEAEKKRAEAEKQQAEAEKTEAVNQLDSLINKAPARRFKCVCLSCGAEYEQNAKICDKDGLPLSMVLDSLKPGDMFAERYEIKRTLGAGGMSTVYLANHVLMNKLMAVKLLHDHLSTDVSAVQRFQREAQTVTLLSHQNILAVHDFGLSQDGLAYLVMDYLDGVSLQEYVAYKKRIHWQKACQFFLQICAGLQHAHIKGVIHRDLKPGNVMMVKDDRDDYVMKIVDFGLAKICDQSSQKLTQTGEIFGSPLYMSPEQCQGADLDHRSDIYAMGIIMYETITGTPPFKGKNVIETFQLQILQPPPALPSELAVPAKLANVIYQALSKEPEQRPQSASEIQDQINAVLAQQANIAPTWGGPQNV